jgi:hypothetical protein
VGFSQEHHCGFWTGILVQGAIASILAGAGF